MANKLAYLKRLQNEIIDMRKTPSENCSAGPITEDNLLEWQATIIGPKDTAFEGGIFKLRLTFSTSYPFQPPRVNFETKMYHPNIDDHGGICLDILKGQWTPALSVSKLLLSICSLLTDPNPDDPLNGEVARVYKRDPLEYNKNVKEYTKIYAMDNSSFSSNDSDDD